MTTHVQHKDAKLCLCVLALEAELLAGGLDVLLELLDGVLEGGAGVVDLVDDEDLLADEVLHLAEAGQVEPLGAGDLLAGLLDDGVAQGLVERQADGLDGDVGAAGLLEERAQDAGGHVAAAADGDHEVGLEVVEDVGGGLLTELVDLEVGGGTGVRNMGFLGCVLVLAASAVLVLDGVCLLGRWPGRSLGSTQYTHIIVGDVELLDHVGRWVAAGSEPFVESGGCRCLGRVQMQVRVYGRGGTGTGARSE